MVTISITHPRARTFELEEKLQKAFSLGDAVVVNTQATPEATSQLVASSAAEYLTGLRPKPRTIGVAWGKTSAGVALAMPERWTNDLRVYQTYGGLVRSNDDVVSHSIGLMAKRGQGVGYMVPAPAIVADERLGTYLMREPAISQTLVHAAQAEILLWMLCVVQRTRFLWPPVMRKSIPWVCPCVTVTQRSWSRIRAPLNRCWNVTAERAEISQGCLRCPRIGRE